MSPPDPTRRRVGLLLAGTAMLLAAVLLSLAVGSRQIAPGEVIQALLHGGTSDNAQVVRSLRVPRTVVGVLVSAALALAGTVMQGVTRNPIAEPGILGVSQGASVGVVCAIAFCGVHTLDGYVWFAFAGAALAAVGVYAVASGGRGGASPVKLALAGAAMNAFLASLVSGIATTNARALDEFRFWQVGSPAGVAARSSVRSGRSCWAVWSWSRPRPGASTPSPSATTPPRDSATTSLCCACSARWGRPC